MKSARGFCRLLLILRRFWGTALASQLEYQLNMLIELLAMLANLAGSLFLLSLFYRQGIGLGGWSWSAAQVVLAPARTARPAMVAGPAAGAPAAPAVARAISALDRVVTAPGPPAC
jgi:hypothetical protein